MLTAQVEVSLIGGLMKGVVVSGGTGGHNIGGNKSSR